MARTPSAQRATPSPTGTPELDQGGVQDLKAEQALALIGMGLMRKLAAEQSQPWMWNGEEDTSMDGASLRQRLQLVDLALRTAAPLTPAEVTHLMGARPGSPVVERGGCWPAASHATFGFSPAPPQRRGERQPIFRKHPGAAFERAVPRLR